MTMPGIENAPLCKRAYGLTFRGMAAGKIDLGMLRMDSKDHSDVGRY